MYERENDTTGEIKWQKGTFHSKLLDLFLSVLLVQLKGDG